MDSGRSPSLINPAQAALLINATCRDGYAQSRPGWNKLTLTGDGFQLGRWQGASSYIGPNGAPYLVASIGGNLVRFNVISGQVSVLSSTALLRNPPNIYRSWFVQAETFLIVQDGSDLPLIFDGGVLRRADPVAFGGQELPVGTVMEYNNGRLWVALPDRRSFVGGNLAYSTTGDASDLLKFTDNTFLTSGSFALPATAGLITAMRSIANQDSVLGQGPLIVAGQFGSATVNAPFDSDAWQNTNSPIVSLGVLSQGPTGQDACINVNGDLWYRSRDGIRSFMIARRDHGTWVNTSLSHEMERILNRDDQYLLDWCSAVDFDNRLLTTCSPFRAIDPATQIDYGVAFRGLTVLDFSPVTSMFDRSQPTWEGIWNGVSILQILAVNCYGLDRCFMFVLNDCFEIELWELTRDSRFDNLTDKISWAMETRRFGFSDKGEALKQLNRTETWFEQLSGTNIGYSISYRPDDSPAWQYLDAGTMCAPTGMCDPPGCLGPNGPRPQYRTRKISSAPNPNDCEEPNSKKYRVGYELQFRLGFSGAGRLRRFRTVAATLPETVSGGCLGNEDCITQTACEPDPWAYRTPDDCNPCAIVITEQPQPPAPPVIPEGTEWDTEMDAPTWDTDSNSTIHVTDT